MIKYKYCDMGIIRIDSEKNEVAIIPNKDHSPSNPPRDIEFWQIIDMEKRGEISIEKS